MEYWAHVVDFPTGQNLPRHFLEGLLATLLHGTTGTCAGLVP